MPTEYPDRASTPGWHIYSARAAWNKDEPLIIAVHAKDAVAALKRLQADDPIWHDQSVEYHGQSGLKPHMKNVLSHYGDKRLLDWWEPK